MHLVPYTRSDAPVTHGRAGILVDGRVVDIAHASAGRLPPTMQQLLDDHPDLDAALRELPADVAVGAEDVRLLAPLPRPLSLRDFMAFEDHVRHTREKRGSRVPDAWYQFPVFYFSNHLAILGADEGVVSPPGCEQLDFEFEVAVVIGRPGRDIAEADAWSHVAGLTIMNDWSARDLQVREIPAGLGPAKGKDFATTMGPALVTLDELRPRLVGDRLSLAMVGRRNGEEFTSTNLDTIYHPIPRIIARASAGVTLHPGEVLGLGTVPNGCLLEQAEPAWLQPGDVVELEVETLGLLRSEVRAGA
ncbi:MAG: fumarylacetoacetate hydrolase family protein [Candidatus Dormibacteraeota bacterium]|nr:fumarylacetoacetate hydrolase family protein [Candidatus Dormibacteraeota bacterium]